MPGSVLTVQTARTEVMADVELKAAVTNAWEEIIEGMLLGRAIWAIRTKAPLGVVGEQSGGSRKGIE